MVHAENNKVHISVTWIQVIVSVIIICSTLVGGLWWLIGARTHAVLNEDFWASERIRPAMKLYIAENTVSRSEFDTFQKKWDISIERIQTQLTAIQSKIDQLSEQSRGKPDKK
jgi:hypothetical protein